MIKCLVYEPLKDICPTNDLLLVRYCALRATGDRDTYRCQNLRGQNLIGTHLDLTLSYTAMGFVSVCTSYCHFFQTSTQ